MSILIVEDNPINAKVLEAHLKNEGYQTILAQNAKKAMEHLTTTFRIQLIITDIMMPEMDGLEFLAKIKEQPEWKDIPVIMCSALADMETVKKAVNAGCKHYIIKPIKKEHLLAKVRDTLEHEKPVLNSICEIRSKFGLDEKTCQTIIQIFASIINDKIALLEKRINGEADIEKSLGLLDLLENAVSLGAERLQILLQDLITKIGKPEDEMRDLEYRLLLRELKILQDALSSMAPNEIPGIQKENKKMTPKKQIDKELAAAR